MSNPRDFRAVLSGKARWSVEMADATEWVQGLPDDSIDLLVTSPPYEDSRTYGLKKSFAKGEEWVRLMFDLVVAAEPKVKGPIVINCEGKTEDFRYSCVPLLLAADLHRAGFNLRKPVAYVRQSFPGSGGNDYLRNDWEPILVITRPGKLPWSDQTACGHPPKYAPGGEMSHRIGAGTRVNQWGMSGTEKGSRRKNGKRQSAKRPSHRVVTKKRMGQHSQESTEYEAPDLANPGNVLKLNVGGNQMGHKLAHHNEAPFPLGLPEFFIRTFAPPDSVVCDLFNGSGTTAQAAIEWGRRFIGCDLRLSQVKLCERRMKTVTPRIPGLV